MGAIIGSLIGDSKAEGSRDAAGRSQGAALEALQKVRVPTIEEQLVTPDLESVLGQLTPEQQQAILTNPSAMEQISTDPALRQAQMNALSSMAEQGRTGLSATDRDALNQIRGQTAQQNQAQQQAILQNMAQRGVTGSGMELAQKLQASQANAQQANQAGSNLAAQAQRNQLAALSQSGQLAGQMENTQFGQASQKAQAQDLINKFNVQNRQQVANTNVQGNNAAQQYNLANKQNVANTNTGLKNQAQYHNKDLYQQQFNNELGKATGVSGQYNKNANYALNDANRIQNMYSGMGQSADQYIMAGGKAVAGGMAHGGMVPMAEGGEVSDNPFANLKATGAKPNPEVAKQMAEAALNKARYEESVQHKAEGGMVSFSGDPRDAVSSYGNAFAPTEENANQLDDLVKKFKKKKPEAVNLKDKDDVMSDNSAGQIQTPSLDSNLAYAAEGGSVPGEAEVPGDSYKNDKVPTMLSPGEVVIPRSKVNSSGKELKQFIDKSKRDQKHEATMVSLNMLNQILKNLGK